MANNYTGIGDIFDLIAVKQRLDESDVFMVRMAVLTSLDAAKRGVATGSMANTLSLHLLTACGLWSQMSNKPLYDAGAKAWAAHSKALARPTDLLDLSTSEYSAIRIAFRHYILALPKLEIGMFSRAQAKAQAELEGS
ncbi:hypothetical protein [Duganella sp. BJB475]|uniref:hypothetical protein n=1 Tax=Duganella sp. BJB475 TaxID=2233914 RepID=UPI000E340A31|nr:hypothetical protein [Duganella sp. BJB475]RFP19174.1 hypothetical protein D0T23_05170 [Duganella sp. BJB475]